MKTTLFLIATLFISTITFSQTTKKGYDHYTASNQSSAAKKMNKGELIDAMAKDANLSKADAGKALNPSISKRAARTGRNPQTGKEIKSARNTNGLPTGRRTYKMNSKTTQANQKAEARHNWMNNPSRATSSKQASGQSKDLHLRKRPGRSQGDPIPGIGITKEQGFAQDGDDLHIRKRPGRSQGDPIPGMDITTEKGVRSTKSKNLRKRPGRSKTVGNYTTINSGKKLRKRPGRTKYKTSLKKQQIDSLKATDYNSSRSNKSY